MLCGSLGDCRESKVPLQVNNPLRYEQFNLVSHWRYLAMEVYTDCAEECMEQLGPDHYVSKALLANLTTLEAEIEVLEIVENSIHSASSATLPNTQKY
mmetsp:Transcript_13159/g.22019  ORF Transcript_13159/g.22019 Transcript_13159/m.22019 type:complete len:98 (+) Transcript_13159:2612-2905(+)